MGYWSARRNRAESALGGEQADHCPSKGRSSHHNRPGGKSAENRSGQGSLDGAMQLMKNAAPWGMIGEKGRLMVMFMGEEFLWPEGMMHHPRKA